MPTNRLVVKEEVATYADVLFEATRTAGGLDRVLSVRNQMEEIISIVNADMNVSMALKDADRTPEQRSALVRGTFAEADASLVDVMAVMAERGDISLLPRVYEAFNRLLADKLNTVVVDVTTVVPLDEELRSTIKQKAETDLGKDVVLRETIDESILGGIIMSTEGKRIDASVISQLNNARIVLEETTDGGES